MKKQKRQVSQSEAMKARWKRRIVIEKSYPESTAQWMAERLERLLDHMLYGHAMIAYHKQNGDFKFVKGTLIYYEAEFHKAYDPTKVEGSRRLLGCGATGMENVPGGELYGMETYSVVSSQ